MTELASHRHPGVRVLLDALRGQWVERTTEGPPAGLVTSRGWTFIACRILHAGAPLGTADGTVLGAVIVGSVLDATGDLEVMIADSDSGRTTSLTLHAPWSGTGPRSARITATASGQVGTHPAGERVHATESALSAWNAQEMEPAESMLLERATDDWLSPSDVISLLIELGVTDDQEIEQRGIDLLARLLLRGDLVAGTIGPDGFAPDDAPVLDVIEHIAATWHALGGRTPRPGQIAWFDLIAQREVPGPCGRWSSWSVPECLGSNSS